MAANTSTTNMGLLLPTVQDDLNAWGGDLNTSLSTVDTHDHSSGKGVQVPSAGININANLSLAQFSLTNIRQLGFYDPASSVVTANQIYVKSGNLFYNDGSSNQIQITTGGGVAGAAGNISGMGAGDSVVLTHATGKLSFNSLSGTANMILQAAEYQAGTQFTFGIGGTPNLTFASSQFSFNNGSAGNGNLLFAKWNADTNDSVDFSSGTTTFNFNTASGSGLASIKAKLHKLSEPTTGTNTVSLAAPSGLASSYTATMPLALPGSKKILTLDSSGNIDDTYDVDNSTLAIASNVIAVKAGGIHGSHIANATVNAVNIPTNYTLTSSCGTFNASSTTPVAITNLSGSITTSGGVVELLLQSDGTTTSGNGATIDASSSGCTPFIAFYRGVTQIAVYSFHIITGTSQFGCLQFTDTGVVGSPGTYTYSAYAYSFTGGTVIISNIKLLIKEAY